MSGYRVRVKGRDRGRDRVRSIVRVRVMSTCGVRGRARVMRSNTCNLLCRIYSTKHRLIWG